MSQIGNLVAFDGAASPVSHTLLPVSVTRSANAVEAYWREGLASVPVYAQVTCTMKIERLKSGVYRLEQRVEIPVMETVSGQNSAGYTAAPKVAYVDTFVCTAFFHERSDIAGRRRTRQLGVNIANGVTTSVAATTTGPAAELFDLLVAPT